MNRRFVFGLIFALVSLIGIAIIGDLAFSAGLAQVAAQAVQVGAVEGGAQAPLYARPFFYPRPFGFGFGLFGLFFTVLIIFLFIGLLRRLFWRGAMGPWAFRGSPGHRNLDHGDVPPAFEEWHRRAHGQRDEPPAQTSDRPQS